MLLLRHMANDFTNNNSAAYANTRVLVVGGTGFIGRWVAKKLYDENAELLIIRRDAEKINNILNEYEINSEIIKADLGEVKFFKHLYDKVKPDIVFNLAGYG